MYSIYKFIRIKISKLKKITAYSLEIENLYEVEPLYYKKIEKNEIEKCKP